MEHITPSPPPKTIYVDIETYADAQHPYGSALNPWASGIRLFQYALDDSDADYVDLYSQPYSESDPFWAQMKSWFEDPNIVKVAHNATFEVLMLTKHFGWAINSIRCTMIMSIITVSGVKFPKTYRYHSLASLSKRLLGVEMDKTEQVSDWSIPILTPSQISYALNDVVKLRSVFQKLNTQIDELDKIPEIFSTPKKPRKPTLSLHEIVAIECESILPFADCTLAGLPFDIQGAERELAKYGKFAYDKLKKIAKFQGVSMVSNKSVKDTLAKLGIRVSKTSVSEMSTIIDLINRSDLQDVVKAQAIEYCNDVSDYRSLVTQYTTFQRCIFSAKDCGDGRLRGNFQVLGSTGTGRSTSSGSAFRHSFKGGDTKALVKNLSKLISKKACKELISLKEKCASIGIVDYADAVSEEYLNDHQISRGDQLDMFKRDIVNEIKTILYKDVTGSKFEINSFNSNPRSFENIVSSTWRGLVDTHTIRRVIRKSEKCLVNKLRKYIPQKSIDILLDMRLNRFEDSGKDYVIYAYHEILNDSVNDAATSEFLKTINFSQINLTNKELSLINKPLLKLKQILNNDGRALERDLSKLVTSTHIGRKSFIGTNVQNISKLPSRPFFKQAKLKGVREFIKFSETDNKKISIVDYAASHLRIAAAQSRDKMLLQILCDDAVGKMMHEMLASKIATALGQDLSPEYIAKNKNTDPTCKLLREASKTVIYSYLNRAGASTILSSLKARGLDANLTFAKLAIKSTDEMYCQVYEWIQAISKRIERHKTLIKIDGRWFSRIKTSDGRVYHIKTKVTHDFTGEINGCYPYLSDATAVMLQSPEAIALKGAMVEIRSKVKAGVLVGVKLISSVHDELNFEVDTNIPHDLEKVLIIISKWFEKMCCNVLPSGIDVKNTHATLVDNYSQK